MLKIKRPSHTTHRMHKDDPATEQAEQKRLQYKKAVLKAYGIVPAHVCFQGKSVHLKPSQTRWEGKDSSLTLNKETANHKSRENDSMNDKLTQIPFSTGQPWGSARRAAEVETRKYEEDVLQAYGLFL